MSVRTKYCCHQKFTCDARDKGNQGLKEVLCLNLLKNKISQMSFPLADVEENTSHNHK